MDLIPTGCEVNAYSSRVCQRGTKCCTKDHDLVSAEELKQAYDKAISFVSLLETNQTIATSVGLDIREALHILHKAGCSRVGADIFIIEHRSYDDTSVVANVCSSETAAYLWMKAQDPKQWPDGFWWICAQGIQDDPDNYEHIGQGRFFDLFGEEHEGMPPRHP